MAISDESSASEKTQCKPEIPNVSQKRNSLRKNITTVSICALTLVIILLLITIILLMQHIHIPITVNISSESTYSQNKSQVNITQQLTEIELIPRISEAVHIVSRSEWLAHPPTDSLNRLHLPIPLVIIHHTSTKNCTTIAGCVKQVRSIQTFHTEYRNWWDIAYNFLVGGNGDVYEGRGWKSEGAHTFGYNAKSIGIAFIGTFSHFKPPDKQIVACKQLIKKGVELGYIKKDYKLLAATQLQTTQSPGAALYEDIKGWDHWSKIP